MKRECEPPTEPRVVANLGEGAVDLVGARHEYQGVAFRMKRGETREFLGGEFPGRNAVERRGAREVFDSDRVRAAARDKRFAGREVTGERGDFQGGGHDDQPQVGPRRFLDLQCAGKRDVAVEVPFVEFVKKDRGDARQSGVGEHLAKEHAFGDVLDPRSRTGDVIEPDPVADLGSERPVVPFAGDAGRQHPCRQPARLER